MLNWVIVYPLKELRKKYTLDDDDHYYKKKVNIQKI